MKRYRLLALLHRRVGGVLSLLIIGVSLSGILINHSQEMGWHNKPVYSSWIGALYGIDKPMVNEGFIVAGHWVYQVGKDLYLGHRKIDQCQGALIHAVQFRYDYVAICQRELIVFNGAADIIDTYQDVPHGIDSLLVSDDVLYLNTRTQQYRWDDTRGLVDPIEIRTRVVADPVPLPAAMRARVTDITPLGDITWERVLLDAHSGRLLGYAGVVVMDIVAILLCLLALTGVYSSYTKWRKTSARIKQQVGKEAKGDKDGKVVGVSIPGR